uniref:Uncharacterized protein n=1 Tax=Arundo donax TaxID=35708 RepID=A0A0A9AGU9_ARUDO
MPRGALGRRGGAARGAGRAVEEGAPGGVIGRGGSTAARGGGRRCLVGCAD